MFSLLYNCALVLFALPKLLFQWSKYKERIRARLGFDLPTFERGKEVIWIHSVSVGETRAAVPLFEKLRQEHPNATLLISTTTETGLAEAKRAMPSATTHFLLPLDLSFLMRRAIRHIQPSLLLLVESDFWYHLISLAKEAGAKVVLVNGKISERSTMRFQKFPLFARKIFTPIDHLCLQSSLYETRFLQIGIPKEKITITGNLKLDHPTAKIPPSLEIPTEDPILTIGSTHSPEEEYILDALESVWKEFPRLKVLLVPRHPERFGAVANLLEAKKIPYSRLSQNQRSGRVILIDTMGKLNACYQISTLALVGGSYNPSVGGHNLFEPISLGIPTLFGPYTHQQSEMTALILKADAGLQVPIQEIGRSVLHLLRHPEACQKLTQNAKNLVDSVQGSTEKTYKAIVLYSEIA